MGMLDSASRRPGIKRVVITASILSIAAFSIVNTGVVVDGRCSLPARSDNDHSSLTMPSRITPQCYYGGSVPQLGWRVLGI